LHGLEAYRALARSFPNGLAEVPPLAEEIAGEVTRGMVAS